MPFIYYKRVINNNLFGGMEMIYNYDTTRDAALLEGVYAHGFLETFFGHDMVRCDNFNTILTYNEIKEGKRDKAIVDCGAMNHNGDIINVRVYLWKCEIMRGIAVTIYDPEGIEYAESRYNAEVFSL